MELLRAYRCIVRLPPDCLIRGCVQRCCVHIVRPCKFHDNTPDDVQLGGQLFKNAGEVDEQRFKNFDVDIDQDEDVPEPIITGTVTSEYRAVLKHAPRWRAACKRAFGSSDMSVSVYSSICIHLLSLRSSAFCVLIPTFLLLSR